MRGDQILCDSYTGTAIYKRQNYIPRAQIYGPRTRPCISVRTGPSPTVPIRGGRQG